MLLAKVSILALIALPLIAQNDLRSGTSTGPVGDLGFAFWFGQHVSVRLGMKDYYYREDRALSQGYSHNVHGYLQTGYIF